MPDLTTLLLFAAACAALFAIPGPAVVYIVARTVAHGRRAGLVSVLGIETGALVHLVAAGLGLSALVASSATAFGVVRYAGAAYLILLGIQALRRHGRSAGSAAPAVPADGRLFRDGVLVNVLNPKVAVFVLAFLPQFVEPGAGSVPAQMLVLGVVYVGVALLLDAATRIELGFPLDFYRQGRAGWFGGHLDHLDPRVRPLGRRLMGLAHAPG